MRVDLASYSSSNLPSGPTDAGFSSALLGCLVSVLPQTAQKNHSNCPHVLATQTQTPHPDLWCLRTEPGCLQVSRHGTRDKKKPAIGHICVLFPQSMNGAEITREYKLKKKKSKLEKTSEQG